MGNVASIKYFFKTPVATDDIFSHMERLSEINKEYKKLFENVQEKPSVNQKLFRRNLIAEHEALMKFTQLILFRMQKTQSFSKDSVHQIEFRLNNLHVDFKYIDIKWIDTIQSSMTHMDSSLEQPLLAE
jgi:hypothetical protein